VCGELLIFDTNRQFATHTLPDSLPEISIRAEVRGRCACVSNIIRQLREKGDRRYYWLLLAEGI
jgi:hypothetical protein